MSIWWELVVLAISLLERTEASHFRGSIISWHPVPNSQYTVEFHYKIAWRRTSQSPVCDAEAIRSRTVLAGEGSWTCSPGCDVTVSSASYVCTDYSELEDWTQGENSFQYTFNGPGPFVITHASCCWISLVGSGSWFVATTVNLNPRPDNGLINSSPISASAPIRRLIVGCTYSLSVHVDDPNGDEVRCRFGVDSSECGSICQGLPGATITSNPCAIHYTASSVGWYAVALMLEDFVSSSSTTPLSKVPLQFLINVRPNVGESCSTPLIFSESTIKTEQRCIPVKPSETFTTTIEVTESPTVRLKEINLVAPPGMTKTPIQQIGSNRGITAQWTPTVQQYGQHVFCFTALDENGASTDQRCVTLLVGASAPDVEPNTMAPVGKEVPVNQRIFTVTFDQEVHRPSVQRNIRIMSTLTDPPTTVVELDTSQAAEVSVEGNTLTFYLPEYVFVLDPGVRHYILMDSGAVVGLMSCSGGGAPFRGISDPNEWSFETIIPVTDPCEKNGGKGECEDVCKSFENIYQCWCDHNSGFLLAADGHSCIHIDNIDKCECVNGACRGGGACECFIGWKGKTCTEPSCRFHDDCSGNGDCIAPDVCACKPGWGGPACNVDFCSRYQSCYSCTRHTGCGWCDGEQRCSAGSGYGPTRSSCESWFYYYCHAIVNDAQSPQSCSLQVTHAQCQDDCLDNDFLRTRGPGSYEYCQKYAEACKRYAKCYSKTPACLEWYEDECRFGLIGERIQRRQIGQSLEEAIHNDVLEPQDSGRYVVTEVTRRIQESGIFPDDKGLLLRIAWVESRFGWDSEVFHSDDTIPVGIWRMNKTALEDTKNVDAHPHLEKKHAEIRTVFGINWKAITTLDLHKPLISGLAARLYLSNKRDVIPSKVEEQAEYWKKNYNTDEGTTAETFLKRLERQPRPSSQEAIPNCVNGIFVRETDSCLCAPDYTGPLCDQLDCGCSGSRQCSGNGACVRSAGPNSKPICDCNFIWEGSCCEICPPVSSRTDPHLETIDGFQFSYFGIGEFISCYSVANGFGVQLRFYKYKHTSMIGAAAVKIGEGVATVVTVNSTQGQYQMPLLRINGTVVPIVVGTSHRLADNSVTLFMNPSTLTGALVQLFFQFKNGATYTIEVRYSHTIGRQFIDTSLGVPIPFMKTTIGLCGNMDGDPNNDFLSPNGTLIQSPHNFTESWRIVPKPSTTAGYTWSWSESNFHPDDPLTFEYTDPNHKPDYSLALFDANVLAAAEDKCLQLGLQGRLLQDCKVDVAVTEDNVFLEQHVFSRGKCHSDCSNHGDCINGTCQCTGLWTGESCNEGGCDLCPPNSDCVNGFCQCHFGYFELEGECIRASCAGVNNCTGPFHGRCKGPDICLCNPGFEGDDCGDISVCYDNCSSHGACTTGNHCICDPNWSGDRCDTPTCDDLQGCSGHGNCSENATCSCESGWSGMSCAIPDCSDVAWCSNEGDCVGPDSCDCYPGYGGPDCSVELLCTHLSNCSGNGACLKGTECLCFEGFSGDTCDTPICVGNCSGHGRCSSAYFCECEEGWIGANCSRPSCEQFKFCSGHGVCSSFDNCDCEAFWKGDACDLPHCPSAENENVDCSGNGQCIGPQFCLCNDTHFGEHCQRPVAATISATPQEMVVTGADKVADFLSNVTILVDRSLAFSCFADGKPDLTVQILKGGQQLTPIQEGNHTSVQLSNLRISDSGAYRCEANNSYRTDIREISVLVMEPPSIVKTKTLKGVTQIGDSANKYVEDTFILTCNTTGHPTPLVTWETDGRSIQPGAILGVELKDDGSALIVHNATVNHAGNYTCTATNMGGTVSRTSIVDVSPCRPNVTMHRKPQCLYTVFLVEESPTIAITRQGLQDLASELDRSLTRNNIGVGNGNYFSVIGFGTTHKARIIHVQSEAIFTHDRVDDAITQLSSTGSMPDGYQAIDFAVKNLRSALKSTKVKYCPTNFVLVTSEARSRAVSLTARKIRKRLCYKTPVILNAILNVGLTVRIDGVSSKGIGLDWRGLPYFKQTTSNGQQYQRHAGSGLHGHLRHPQTSISPVSFSVCSSFRDYGDMALRTNGAFWDVYSTFTPQDRSILFSALTNSTISSLEAFQPCVDCRCKRTKAGSRVKICYSLKDNDICKCRLNGDSIRTCKRSVRGLCRTKSAASAHSFTDALTRGCQSVVKQ